MEIDLIFKIAAIGIIVAVLNQLLIRSGREDQAMMTTLAGLVALFFPALPLPCWRQFCTHCSRKVPRLFHCWFPWLRP